MSRTYACADLHGQRGLWEQIKTHLQPEDRLYFLGDAIDRGPDGYNIMKELLSDNRVTYIKGNHELMMEEAIREISRIQYDDSAYMGEKYRLWAWNGCTPTFADWAAAGAHYDITTVLHNLPDKEKYINKDGYEICLCHAGFTPGHEHFWTYDMVWNREHLLQEIPDKYKHGNFIVVHGHTPTPYLMMDIDERNRELAAFYRGEGEIPQYKYEERNGAVFYGDGTKIDIDCGAFATGHTVLLDLDTWEVIPFDADIEE